MKIKMQSISKIMLALMIIKTMLIYSNFLKISDILELVVELVVYIYIVFFLLLNIKIKRTRVIQLVAIGILTLISGILTHNFVILSSFLVFCLASTISDFREVSKVIFKTIFCVLVLHFILYFAEYFRGNIIVILDASGRIRHNLGFSHPNVSSTYVLWCFCAYYYSYKDKFNWKKVLVLSSLVFIIYLFNLTRTLFFCLVIFLILIVVEKNFKKLIHISAKYVFVLVSIATIFLVELYADGNSFVVNKIDPIVSSRLFFSVKAKEYYGYTMIGHEIPDVVIQKGYYSGKIIIDNTYVSLLFEYGWIYIILMALLAYFISKKEDICINELIIILACYSFFEMYTLNFVICFPFLYGASWIRGGVNGDSKEN